MPELPEVETIVKRLKSELVGEVITRVEVKRAKSFQGNTKQLKGRRIVDVSRRAKLILIKLNQDNLLIHLKMTGQLILINDHKRLGGGHPSADWIGGLPSSHTRVIIYLMSGQVLYFNDQRVFGWIRQMSDQAVDQELAQYGPDIINVRVTAGYLYQRLQARSSAIKLVLLDSRVVAGLGNIYVCDGLFLAGINPQKKAKTVSLSQVTKLLTALKTVINRAIKLGGASINTYRQVDGLSGGYQDELLVYGREDMPCPQCGAKIERFKQGGRSTFWCRQCQR
ncbi:bifunctional DNA-formamidopyrimidine glycosylase/DNA-(apurinic or apyrimidinic site) lyase [Patescibacteria group bacterium]|nr:bifunctional DNA-formamidopyrimidine glycosylase/DNA-(apurinic or apyrimidinic site) lyase [Patescibacteria group bacterium]